MTTARKKSRGASRRRPVAPSLNPHELAELREEYGTLIEDLVDDEYRPLLHVASDAVVNDILLAFVDSAAVLRDQQPIEGWIAEQYELDDENSETGYTTLNGLLRAAIYYRLTAMMESARRKTGRKRGKAVA